MVTGNDGFGAINCVYPSSTRKGERVKTVVFGGCEYELAREFLFRDYVHMTFLKLIPGGVEVLTMQYCLVENNLYPRTTLVLETDINDILDFMARKKESHLRKMANKNSDHFEYTTREEQVCQ